MKTIIEIHVLQNFAPSNLNRDDTGAPKDALFGGTRRARVSSQCLKRSVRSYFSDHVGENGLVCDDVGSRTKRVLESLIAALVKLGRDDRVASEKVRLALSAVELSIKEDGKSEYLLFLGQREIAGIADIIHERWDSIDGQDSTVTDGKKSGKAKKKAADGADPELKRRLERVFDGGKAVDVALFGRMLADMPEGNQNAACQVAHAISTHSVDREFDFFTAVDDLKPEDSAGADMMGTVEFNSACFYRYAVIDWEKLASNLQEDRALALKGVRAFLEGFIVAEPTGKQNSFAAHNPPEFVTICVRRNAAPRSLANAFESALRNKRSESITMTSATALITKAKLLEGAFGGKGKTSVLNLVGADIAGFASDAPSLEILLDQTLAELT